MAVPAAPARPSQRDLVMASLLACPDKPGTPYADKPK